MKRKDFGVSERSSSSLCWARSNGRKGSRSRRSTCSARSSLPRTQVICDGGVGPYVAASLIEDRSGPDAVATILSELRNDATSSANRVSWPPSLLHGPNRGKRGLFASALWHVKRSHQILESAPNSRIEAQSNSPDDIAVLSADHISALKHGQYAIELAEQSGGAACKRTALGNLGFVFYSLGHFDEAVKCLERAIAVLPSPGESHSAMIDTLARIRLAQGRQGDCQALLDRIENELQLPSDRLLYPHRHASFTRAHQLARDGQFENALAQIDRTLNLADEAKDQFLLHRGLLTKAQFLQQAGREAESQALMDTPVFELVAQAPDLHAQYKTIVACGLATAGQYRCGARSPFARGTTLL